MNKNKHIITDVISYNSYIKKFFLSENYNLLTSPITDPNFCFLILRVLSPRKMKNLFGNLYKDKEFDVPWVEVVNVQNHNPELFLLQEVIFDTKKFVRNSIYVPELNFRQYIKHSGYPKVINIPKIEVNFL